MAPSTDESPKASRHPLRKRVATISVVVLVVAMVVCGMAAVRHLRGLPWGSLFRSADGTASVMPQSTAERDYPRAVSPIDFNGNGVDDYADIVAGAKEDAARRPTYDSGYYEGGYPPDDRGACTDVVWRAFRAAGYDLKAMVDADIAADPADYAAVASEPDPNIDFRRTGVLDVFFAKYGQRLTTDVTDAAQWQGGDIVVFETTRHIGVVSDTRDAQGTPYIIHNMGQRRRENDYLAFRRHMTVTGHYRFDASKVPQDVLKAWRDR